MHYNSIGRMEGWRQLKDYFDISRPQNIDLLKDNRRIRLLAEEINLVLLLRYIENIQSLDIETALKTLLLVSRLAIQYRQKVRGMIPFQKISFELKGLDQLQRIFIDSLITCINQSIESQENLQEQLETSTKGLWRISQIIEFSQFKYKCYAQMFYWIVQQRLYQLWLSMSSQLKTYDHMQLQQFQSFYNTYNIFCTFRRKIPRIKHRNLKAIEISPLQNSKIVNRYSQLLNPSQEADKEQFIKINHSILKAINDIDWQQFD